MGAFEGRKDRFGFLVDVMYLQLSQTKPAPLPLFGDVHARPTQQAYALAGTWRALPGAAPVDLVVGVRINDVKLDLDLSSSALAPNGRTVVRSRSWADGFVGVRAQYPIAPQWSLVGYVDLGGGGSDFTWQALAGVNYAISPTMTAKFGYRYLKVDYHRDEFLYDIATSGIYAGMGFRF
jgi:opacity protein-like surface antigen